MNKKLLQEELDKLSFLRNPELGKNNRRLLIGLFMLMLLLASWNTATAESDIWRFLWLLLGLFASAVLGNLLAAWQGDRQVYAVLRALLDSETEDS